MKIALPVLLMLLLPACCAKKKTTATDTHTTEATAATTQSRVEAVETIKTAARFRADSVVVRVISDTVTKTVTIYRPRYITMTADSTSTTLETAAEVITTTAATAHTKTTSDTGKPWWAYCLLALAAALTVFIFKKLLFG